MQYAANNKVIPPGPITIPATSSNNNLVNNVTNPKGVLGLLHDILPWISSLVTAFGKQSLWANLASSLGILWKAASSFTWQGLGAASLDLIKYGTFAGLGGFYGIPKLKQSVGKFPLLNKNWAQVLVGLFGVIGLSQLSNLFDEHIKNKLLKFIGKGF